MVRHKAPATNEVTFSSDHPRFLHSDVGEGIGSVFHVVSSVTDFVLFTDG